MLYIFYFNTTRFEIARDIPVPISSLIRSVSKKAPLDPYLFQTSPVLWKQKHDKNHCSAV